MVYIEEGSFMIRAHKIRLNPTAEQANYFARAAGTSRNARELGTGGMESEVSSRRETDGVGPKEAVQCNQAGRLPLDGGRVTKNASDQPFLDLGKAFTAFFEGLKNGKRRGRPRFKSKKRRAPRFYLANDQCELGDHRIWIPKLGWVNMAENLRFKGRVTGVRITKTADWWFASPSGGTGGCRPCKKHQLAIGIDVGFNRLATLSTGEEYENQAFLQNGAKKLRRANKRLHRRVKGSKNREKARREAARLHYQITCMRDDALHKLTTQLASCYGIVGIEDLNLNGLLKNRRLSRSFSDAALGKLLSLLTSKADQQGGQVIRVGRFFPSSKTCHACGWKWEDMELSDRLFLCQNPAMFLSSVPAGSGLQCSFEHLGRSPPLDRAD